MWKFIKLSNAAQNVAHDMARKGLDGNLGDPLPNLLENDTYREINANLVSFRLAIHLYRVYKFHNAPSLLTGRILQ